MRSELQPIVDGLAERVDLPTQLTDSHLESLVFGPHQDVIDWIRRETLLQRRTPPEIRSYLEQFGVASATEPFRIPSDPQREVMSRVVVPVRSHGLTYGYLWFLDDERRMTESQLGDAVKVAAEIGQILYLDQRLEQADTGLVRDLLADSLEVRQRAVDQVLNRNLFPAQTSAAVGLLLHPADEPGTADHPGAASEPPVGLTASLHGGRWRRLPATVLRYTEARHTVLVIPVGGRDPHAAARTMAARARELWLPTGEQTGPLVVGVGDPQPDLGHARESHRQAALAARVAQQVRGTGPVAEWRHLGVYRALSSIPADQLDTAALDPRIRTILDAGDPSLVTTLEAYLDSGCDMKRTCGLLKVHRGTVYYRLQKAESLSGLRLADGMDRLALHLGLKIARLAGLTSG
jgi:hypothetical protein